jgi:hypothetical protein
MIPGLTITGASLKFTSALGTIDGIDERVEAR